MGYAAALLTVALSTLAGLAMAPQWGNSAVDLLYLPTVLGIAVIAGFGPAVVAAVLSTLAYNYFFTVPYHSLRVDRPSDIVTVIMLFVVALVTSRLAAGMRNQAQIAQAHASRNATIAGLARRLLSCTSAQEIAQVGTKELAQLFECNAVLLTGRPEPRVVAAEPESMTLTPSDLAGAALALATGEPNGRGITRAATIEWQFHPVRSEDLSIAAVGLARDDGMPPLAEDQLPLLGSLVDQIALGLERAKLESEARDFAALRERDRVRAVLLSSIGQDVNPRLSAIASAVGELRRSGSAEKSILSTIASEASRLQRYMGNLLDLEPDRDQSPLEVAGVKIDIFHRAVFKDGKEVHLTPKEYAVLAELAKHPGRVLSHAHLLKTAWGPAQETQTEYLRVAVRALRQKLERNPARPKIIINEPAVGYRLTAVLDSADREPSGAIG
jgi:K+-sensing histidine kinase KdpD/DNA-binding winged helix-turn-helix (wHTH) protein